MLSKDQIISSSQTLDSNNEQKGIYFLIKSNEIIYVGRSSTPQKRIKQHARKKDFDKYVIEPALGRNLTKLEATYIKKFSPKKNKRSGSAGSAPEGQISLRDFCKIMDKNYDRIKHTCTQNNLGHKQDDKILLSKSEVLSITDFS